MGDPTDHRWARLNENLHHTDALEDETHVCVKCYVLVLCSLKAPVRGKNSSSS